MTGEIGIRLLLALAIGALGYALYHLGNRAILAKARRSLAKPGAPAQPDLPSFHTGTLAILYFTTPDCAPCRTQQKPALQRLKTRFGEDHLQLIEVNTYESPDLASRWGVMSVPTTFIIDRQGQPRFVNHGVTSAEKLFAQLEKAL
jgi:thiol-disulfide isomerase/thioredoxin